MNPHRERNLLSAGSERENRRRGGLENWRLGVGEEGASSPRPSPPQVCGGEGDGTNGFNARRSFLGNSRSGSLPGPSSRGEREDSWRLLDRTYGRQENGVRENLGSHPRWMACLGGGLAVMWADGET
jgi:hypothetical protein